MPFVIPYSYSQFYLYDYSNDRLKMTRKNGAPGFSRKAVISACSSGRKLSWKIQESEKGTLIQLVWKTANSFAGDSGEKTEVHSN